MDLRFSYGVGGLEREFGRSARQLFEDSADKWSAGAVVSIPIGNRDAAGAERIAKRRIAQTALQAESLRVGIAIDTANSVQRIDTLRRRLENTRQSRALAAAGLEAELTRLDAGKTTSFAVLDLQQKASEARTRELAARVDLKKAEAELWATVGELPAKLGVAINPPSAADPKSSFFRWTRATR